LGEVVSGWARLCQIGRGCVRLGEVVSDWARLCQVGRSCVRLGEVFSDWARLSQIGRGCRAQSNVVRTSRHNLKLNQTNAPKRMILRRIDS